MTMLIEVVDELQKLNEISKMLGGLGYYENFGKLNNVFDVIWLESIFCGCETDEQMRVFYEIVEDRSKTPTERAEILLKHQKLSATEEGG